MNKEKIDKKELMNIVYDTLAKNTNWRQLPLEWIEDIDNDGDTIQLNVNGKIFQLSIKEL